MWRDPTNVCVKILLIYAAANIEVRTVKYLHKVGENLIFLAQVESCCLI